jgi:hypothetical protein
MSASVVSYFFVEMVRPLVRGDDHLAQNRLFLLQLGQLLLEVSVLFLLVCHAQLQTAVERLDERSSSLDYFLVDVIDLGLH